MQSKNNLWFLLLIPVVFVSWFLIRKSENKPLRTLPYYGPKNLKKQNDSDYHRISDFRFINQYGEITDEKTIAGKIYVTEFFFTTCQSICPVMNDNMQKVYKAFNSERDFLILSHTVDPETDSVAAMKNYAAMHGVKDRRWLFLTGEKKHLYDMARNSYLLDAQEGNGGPEDFIHTQNFALIDKERRIRGYYDGTDSAEVQKLIREIKLLMQEYDHKED